MPLYIESAESVANAIVTLNRALEHGVIEVEKYKGFNDYLEQQKKVFRVKKSHLDKANLILDEELESEAKEFFMEEGDVLYKMSEELLEEHEKDLGDDDTLLQAEEAAAEDWHKQSEATKAWAKMSDKERAEIAVLASEWQKSRV